MKRAVLTISLIILIIVALPILSSSIRIFYKNIALSSELFPPTKKLKLFTLFTSKPSVKEIEFTRGGKKIKADLWVPKKTKANPAVVLSLGVDIRKDDPRNVLVADRLSRMGIVALIPEIQSLSNRRVTEEGVDDLRASFQYLEKQEFINKDRIGFFGFCASGGLTLLAAEDREINERVDFIQVVNPYFDIPNLYEPFVMGKVGGKPFSPHPKSVEIFNREIIENFPNTKQDKEILKKNLVDIPTKAIASQRFDIPKEEFIKLSNEGRFTYQLLTNKPNQKEVYIKTIENNNKGKFLSPSSDLKNLKSRLFIVADKNNVYVPYTQSNLLKDEAADLNLEYVFFETSLLPGGDLNWGFTNWFSEAGKMFLFTTNLFLHIGR